MITSLHRFIDPANYHPDAVAEAGLGEVSALASNWLIIRLGLELHRGDWKAAEAALLRLEAEQQQGYGLFQVVTARLILAIEGTSKAAIMAAIDVWLEARRTAPGSWRSDVLDAPELAPYIAEIDPARLAPPAIRKTVITKADRAMVRDISAAREQAVTENLEWLRPIGVTGSVKAIARTYRLAHASHELREITLRSRQEDWPDLIVALDDDGAVTGSFIAH